MDQSIGIQQPDYVITICQRNVVRRRFEVWERGDGLATDQVEGLIGALDEELLLSRSCVDGEMTAGKYDGERLQVR